jgi:hypothetical protein
VVVAAPYFTELARLTGFNQGVPSLQVATYPGAFSLHSDTELADNTTKIVFPQIVDLLTQPIKASENRKAETADPRTIVFKGDLDQVNRQYLIKKWTDGLPVIPPTIKRVEEFLKFTDSPPDQVIALLPSKLKATVWNIAVNGVMAGCRPEYLPILIAAVEAMASGSNDALGSSGTHSNIPYLWINGPVGRQLGIDHGQGLITHQINNVLGRALSLIIGNIAGYRIKEKRVGSFGYPQSWVLAEDEKLLFEIGWEPYHVEKGFDKNSSTVTGNCSTLWGQNNIPATSEAKTVMQLIAREITYKEGFASGSIGSNRTELLTPPVARVLAKAGYTKQSLKEALIQTARIGAFEYNWHRVYGSFGKVYPSFDETLGEFLASPQAEKGKLPPWYPDFPGRDEFVTTPSIQPGKLEILICGDPSRNKTQTMAGPGASSPPPTREIKLPAKWNELMEKIGYRPLQKFYL